MFRLIFFLFAAAFAAAIPAKEVQPVSGAIQWQRWSPEVFERAEREGRLVLVDLVAEWCAFCKKMDATTYRDAGVLKAIGDGYIPVRADPEKDSGLPARFVSYGRPSTVILTPDGGEILKKQGYLKPQWMLWTLQAVAQEAR